MRISDWSSDVCSSDLPCRRGCSASWNLSLLVPQLGGVENVELRTRRGLRVGTARKRMPHQRWPAHRPWPPRQHRSEEHTSELQSLMRISYAVFCLKKKNQNIYDSTY